MKIKIINFWDALKGSYWFVPSLMSLGAIFLSIGCLHLDRELSLKGAEKVAWLWAGGTDGARTILSTVASSMITVAGVVFSITIVALTLASSQFGPSLLRNFVRDTINQVVLGTFVATYLYCLLVLREVRDVNDISFVPYLSVTVAIVLTTASLGMLIFFIHHVAISIQAENMVGNVAAELRTSIESLFPEKLDASLIANPKFNPIADETEHKMAVQVTAKRAGYIQAIEIESLIERAKALNVTIRLFKRPGEFIFSGGTLAEIQPGERVTEELITNVSCAHVIEDRRSPRQDAEYCINQLVEIAVRALSPGINDPFTAMACIRWLGDGISQAAQRKMPEGHRYDEDGIARLTAKVATFEGLIDAAFNTIRQYGSSCPAVALCLLETISDIAPHTVRSADIIALELHAEMTARDAMAVSPDMNEIHEIESRLINAREAFAQARTKIY